MNTQKSTVKKGKDSYYGNTISKNLGNNPDPKFLRPENICLFLQLQYINRINELKLHVGSGIYVRNDTATSVIQIFKLLF